MALPENVEVLYENQEYSPKLQYMTGVARDDASYLLCKEVGRACCAVVYYVLYYMPDGTFKLSRVTN